MTFGPIYHDPNRLWCVFLFAREGEGGASCTGPTREVAIAACEDAYARHPRAYVAASLPYTTMPSRSGCDISHPFSKSIATEQYDARVLRERELERGIVGDARLARIADRPGEACDQDVQVIARELLARRKGDITAPT